MSNQKSDQNIKEDKSKTIADVYSDNTVYSLTGKPKDDIVDLVLKIMDGDGPRPMKNLRPVQKTRNGADQFYVDHHGEYEARGQPSRDKIGRVHTHNNAYPKMYDELNRRRSTAQPAIYLANPNPASSADFDPNCSTCLKFKKEAEFDDRRKRRYRTSRHRRSYAAKTTARGVKNRITKPRNQRRRYRSPSAVFKLSKIRTNKGCQVTSYPFPTEKRSVCTIVINDDTFSSNQPMDADLATMSSAPPVNNLPPHGNTVECCDSNPGKQQSKKQEGSKKPSKSDIDSGNPETNTAPSISSYNSFMSMEHEPMVE